MFFGKKKKTIKCDNCSSKLNKKFSFCPYCGEEIYDEKDPEDFGLLGEDDEIEEAEENFLMPNLGITDKIFSSLMNNLAKTLSSQMRDMNSQQNKTQVKSIPNGIRIMIGTNQSRQPISQQSPQRAPAIQPKKEISEEQIKKMSNLPRTSAKTKVKRLSDKIIYELSVPGIKSQDDIFVSKVESGYEIKAVGEKKIYSNTIPLNLPIKNLSLINSNLIIEFPSVR